MKEKEVFISFSSRESDQAFRICKMIEDKGFTCFIAPRNLVPGEEYASQLIDNISGAKVVVLLLSEASNKSPHVLREIEYAVSQKIPILVYALEPVELTKSLKYFLMTHQWIQDGKDKDKFLIQGVKNAVSGKMEFPESLTIPEDKNSTNQNNQKKKTWKPWFIGILLGVLLLAVILVIYFTKKEKAAPEDIPVESRTAYSLGDTVTFGMYQDKPIEWRVIKINDDKTLVLLAKEILSMKTYDAAEAGNYNNYEGVDYWSYENHQIEDKDLQILVRGNADWSESNLRTWLNSEKELVTYSDQAPTYQAVGKDFYNSEAGFLYNFTEDERNSIIPVTHKSKNTDATKTETTDAVWLLSEEELELLKTADVSLYAIPSDICIEKTSDIKIYKEFVEVSGINSYYWWLRDSSEEKANEALFVATEYESDVLTMTGSVGVCCYGVRPAICVDTSKWNQ